MDHLSTMKRKNVVLVYDLLLEMLDANTSSSSSQTASSSPSSDACFDQQQYHPPASHLQHGPHPTITTYPADDSPTGPPQGPAEDQILERHLHPVQSSPPSQSFVRSQMDSDE